MNSDFPVTNHETNYLKYQRQARRTWRAVADGTGRMDTRNPRRCGRKPPRSPMSRHLNMSNSTSEQMIRGKYQGKFLKDSIIKSMTDALVMAKEKGIQTVGVNAEDASRTEMPYLIEYSLAAKEHGADPHPLLRTHWDTMIPSPYMTGCLHSRKRSACRWNCIAITISVWWSPPPSQERRQRLMAVWTPISTTTINGMGERAGNADLISVIPGDQVRPAGSPGNMNSTRAPTCRRLGRSRGTLPTRSVFPFLLTSRASERTLLPMSQASTPTAR